MRRRLVIAALVLAALLLAATAAALGVPGPSRVADAGPPASDAASASSAPGVPEPDPSSPLHTDIPGCVCHSDDRAIVEEHAAYRMNQCFGCHKDGMPEMGRR